MTFFRTCAAPLLLLTPMLFAQQPGPQGGPPPMQSQGQGPNQPGMHRGPADQADRQQMMDQQQEMYDEREDLGELGLPVGAFWLNPDLVAHVHITPDQVHRLADTYLQGRLKIIQLEANEEMEETKLDAMESEPMMNDTEALAQTDRLADARAATEKADAHLAFALRAILNPDQLTTLRNGYMHVYAAQVHGNGQAHHSAGAASAKHGAAQPAAPPA